MAKGKAATLKGIFGHMLDEVLKVAKKSGRKLDADKLIKGHGKNVAKADHISVFKAGKTKNLTGKTDEYVRQLQRQINGINNMTADELLHNLNTVKRKGLAQKEAREQYKDHLLDKYTNEYRLQGKTGREAKKLAEERASKEMSTLAALHEPDIVAGGKDVIGVNPDGLPSMGDKWVNSSIGSQWKQKGLADNLKRYAEQLRAAGKGDQLLNVDFILE